MKAIRQMRNMWGGGKERETVFKIGEASIITEDCKKGLSFLQEGESWGMLFIFLRLFLPEAPQIETKFDCVHVFRPQFKVKRTHKKKAIVHERNKDGCC